MVDLDRTRSSILKTNATGVTIDQLQNRLIEAMEEVVEAMATKNSFDRQVLLDKYQDIAEELEDCLCSILFVQEVAPQLEDQAKDGGDVSAIPITRVDLGDFRIRRELGRGGMGVVYEAEQLSLGRRVALKVLPFAAMLESHSLNRFKNEARAAATLDHPNIVSVYSVGMERGVHYYAMQLIDGQSLAQLIVERRGNDDSNVVSNSAENASPVMDTRRAAKTMVGAHTPSELRDHFESVARLGVQAAEALEHAHQNGVLHRDIKPANLLLDSHGKLYVTDFGLARIQTSTEISATGDVLGTLRYMSPEQAKGELKSIDERSDVYSLGITLFELLTYQPAFSECDRAKLLQSIVSSECSSPRNANDRVPKDLDTIVKAATAQDANDRYISMQAFANDLKRFLDSKPILAKSPTVVQRGTKLLRRHQKLAWIATTGLLILTIAINVVLIRENRLYQRSLAAEKSAEENINVASSLTNLYLLARVNETGMEDHLKIRKHLTKAIADVTLIQEKSASDETLFSLAQLYWARARNAFLVGIDGRNDIEFSLDSLKELSKKHPNDNRFVRKLDEVYAAAASDLMSDLRHAESLEMLRRSAAYNDKSQLSDESRSWLFGMSGYIKLLVGRTTDAEIDGRRALRFAKSAEQQNGVQAHSFNTRSHLAETLLQARDWDDLAILLVDVKHLVEQPSLTKEDQYVLFEFQKARARIVLARHANLSARPGDAIRILQPSIKQLSQIRQHVPSFIWAERFLAIGNQCLSDAYIINRDIKTAKDAIEASLLYASRGNQGTDRLDEARSLFRFGHLLFAQGDMHSAKLEFDKSINKIKEICFERPNEIFCHRYLLAFVSTCPLWQENQNEIQYALKVCERFRDQEEVPPLFLRYLALAYCRNGQASRALPFLDLITERGDAIDQFIATLVLAESDPEAALSHFKMAADQTQRKNPVLFIETGPLIFDSLRAEVVHQLQLDAVSN